MASRTASAAAVAEAMTALESSIDDWLDDGGSPLVLLAWMWGRLASNDRLERTLSRKGGNLGIIARDQRSRVAGAMTLANVDPGA